MSHLYFCTCYTASSLAYKAQILQPQVQACQPAPKPLRNSHAASALATILEPIAAAYSICFRFCRSAQDFLCTKMQFQRRSPNLYVQLSRQQPLMRTFMSFNYWMKWVQRQRPLSPIFDKLFITDIAKKTKTLLTVCLSTDISDKHVEVKLCLAIEHIKRTVSASPKTVLNHLTMARTTQAPLIA